MWREIGSLNNDIYLIGNTDHGIMETSETFFRPFSSEIPHEKAEVILNTIKISEVKEIIRKNSIKEKLLVFSSKWIYYKRST